MLVKRPPATKNFFGVGPLPPRTSICRMMFTVAAYKTLQLYVGTCVS